MAILATLQRSMALVSEELFWRYWVLTGGRSSAVTIQELIDPARPFTPMLRACVDELEKKKIRVIDVGSGPITHIGRVHPFLSIEVVATDFLASRYNRILSAHKIIAPVATQFADAEKLTELFSENSFDLAVANNSLDHCASPLTAIDEMIKVVSPDCSVFLRHRENEAVRAKYRGLHQWNFQQKDGNPFLWNRDERINLREYFGSRVSIETVPEVDHIVIVLKKNRPH
jgi:SAM-dependent methyltransferase